MRSIREVQAGVAAGEVRGDPFADRARLADVEQLAVAVVEEVDAGLVGQRTCAAARSARRGSALVRRCPLPLAIGQRVGCWPPGQTRATREQESR